MEQFRLLIFVILLASPASVICNPTEERQTHPGCIIWWFLPGCPLASFFGPDPLNFYPWEKFCVNYTAFDDTEFCKKVTPLREDSTPTEDETRQTKNSKLLLKN